MSLYIAINWFGIGREQIDQLIGRSADQSFIKEIHELASQHHPLLMPDIIRAYHFGARFLVEMEVVLPAEMSVREAHDISLELQQAVEQLEDVERAFVHVDYRSRGDLGKTNIKYDC
jgi:divalent metal cation (Fe/Co/Zn/Cd) transporter